MISNSISTKSLKKMSTRALKYKMHGKAVDRTVVSEANSENKYSSVKIDNINEMRNQELKKELLKAQSIKEDEINKYKRTLVRRTREERIFCVSADGTETSKQAFEIVTKEFLNSIPNSAAIFPNICNDAKDSKFNWRFQKNNVLDYYTAAINASKRKKDEFYIIQDRDVSTLSEIEQVYNIAVKNTCEYFVVGFNGLKGPTANSQNIPKNLDFLLNSSRMPTFIMKDKLLRGEKNEGYNWLLVLDRADQDCLLAFDYFKPLMNTKLDMIHGLTLLPPIISKDDVEKKFYEKMKEAGFNVEEQVSYACDDYKDKVSEYIIEYVNHSQLMYFDFVIIYNNPNKYSINREKSEIFKVMEKVNANLCFVNGYIEKYKPKNIEIVDNE